jgi:uncharacterized protein with PQ loop repeat
MLEIIREIAGALMVFCFMFCYIPQIVKIYKNKSSRDVSLMLILMSIGGYISGLVYMTLNGFGLWWFLNYCTGLVMCGILVHAWFKYKK